MFLLQAHNEVHRLGLVIHDSGIAGEFLQLALADQLGLPARFGG